MPILGYASEASNIELTQTDVFDQKIRDLLESETFKKVTLECPWKGKVYSVHVLYNPLKEHLFCRELSKPVRWPFVFGIDSNEFLPSLVHHIKSLVPTELILNPDNHGNKYPFSYCKNLEPITFSNSIENAELDKEIYSLFKSDNLAKKSIFYELSGKLYKVLLIHNPKKINLDATFSFKSREFGMISVSPKWSSKVGIFVDRKAPQELIDHISKLIELSWWDYYMSFVILNGDSVEVTHIDYGYEYIYKPITWYEVMLNAKP